MALLKSHKQQGATQQLCSAAEALEAAGEVDKWR